MWIVLHLRYEILSSLQHCIVTHFSNMSCFTTQSEEYLKSVVFKDYISSKEKQGHNNICEMDRLGPNSFTICCCCYLRKGDLVSKIQFLQSLSNLEKI